MAIVTVGLLDISAILFIYIINNPIYNPHFKANKPISYARLVNSFREALTKPTCLPLHG
jgi:hypothetical protein